MKNWYCVLDFEATCWEERNMKSQSEIIEFPSVLICHDTHQNTCEIISEFHEYCRPVLNPVLSEFCNGLTGITQEQVDAADIFPNVYRRHYEWLVANTPAGITPKIITCGGWDIKTMLPMELARYPDLPIHHPYTQFVNIKKEFETFYGKFVGGMYNMLKALNMTLDGRHHSGIDDTRNITKILVKMLTDGHRNLRTVRVE